VNLVKGKEHRTRNNYVNGGYTVVKGNKKVMSVLKFIKAPRAAAAAAPSLFLIAISSSNTFC
jgi:hypothetical protein